MIARRQSGACLATKGFQQLAPPQVVQAGAGHLVVDPRRHLLENRVGGLVRALRRLALLGFGEKLAESDMRLPDLGWIADLLGQAQGLVEHGVRLVPLPACSGDLAFEPPALDEILSRARACGTLQALICELARSRMRVAGEGE